MAVSEVAHPHGGRPAAILYPFGHPTTYVYGHEKRLVCAAFDRSDKISPAGHQDVNIRFFSYDGGELATPG
jgi:hypothetical protein